MAGGHERGKRGEGRMTRDARQMTLELAHDASMDSKDFTVSISNREAVDAMSSWMDWPSGRMALIGPESCGKSHLAQIWRASTGGALVGASELTDTKVRSLLLERAVVIEDVDRLAQLPGPVRRQCEQSVLHLYNFANAEGMTLLITGQSPPAHWDLVTPDLGSRLATLAITRVYEPDDALLSSVMTKLFLDRQLNVGQDVIDFLVIRMERSFSAAERIVERLDKMALEQQRPITRPLAIDLYMEETSE